MRYEHANIHGAFKFLLSAQVGWNPSVTSFYRASREGVLGRVAAHDTLPRCSVSLARCFSYPGRLKRILALLKA